MFTKKDYQELETRGIAVEDIEEQLNRFKEGFPYLSVTRPATAGDGILRPGEDTLDDFIHLYDTKSVDEKVLKFVPASGAATRMFRDLYAFAEQEGDEVDRMGVLLPFLRG